MNATIDSSTFCWLAPHASRTKSDLDAFAEFRRGLLKHIAMEEKILLPAIQALRNGDPLPIAARLRRERGAIAALLVPSPRPAVLGALNAVLLKHNANEEGPEGVYAQCDRIADPEPRRC